jgi:hypothetical protein
MRSRKAAQQQARQEAAEVNPEAPDVELIERGKDAAAAVVDQVVVEVEGTDGVKEGHEEKAEVDGSEEGRVKKDCSRASGPGQEEAAVSVAVVAAAAAATSKGTWEQQDCSKKGLVVFGLEVPGIWGPWQPALLGPTAFAGAMAGFLAGLFGAVRRCSSLHACCLRKVLYTCSTSLDVCVAVILHSSNLLVRECALRCVSKSGSQHTLLLLLLLPIKILRQSLEPDFYTIGQQGGPPVLVLFSWIGSHKDFAIPPGILRGTAISTYWVSMVIRFAAVLGQGILFLDRYPESLKEFAVVCLHVGLGWTCVRACVRACVWERRFSSSTPQSAFYLV